VQGGMPHNLAVEGSGNGCREAQLLPTCVHVCMYDVHTSVCDDKRGMQWLPRGIQFYLLI
jgi:hypothetical protein